MPVVNLATRRAEPKTNLNGRPIRSKPPQKIVKYGVPGVLVMELKKVNYGNQMIQGIPFLTFRGSFLLYSKAFRDLYAEG